MAYTHKAYRLSSCRYTLMSNLDVPDIFFETEKIEYVQNYFRLK